MSLWKCVVLGVNSHVLVIVNGLWNPELILCASYTHPEEVFTQQQRIVSKQHVLVQNPCRGEETQSNFRHVLKSRVLSCLPSGGMQAL